MTILLSRTQLRERAKVVAESFAPLARSLGSQLDDVIVAAPQIPEEKAKLTRAGGRCPNDGTQLDFDPFLPHLHRCSRCNNAFTGEEHHRWWIMSQQLFLAERAVHGALLFGLTRHARYAAFSEMILERYAELYLFYPNRDNVLGPTRPFFSTYLESIWLLQICVAADLLAGAGRERAAEILQVVCDRIVEPSAALIASYDEGGSNRQAWNSAALMAAARLTRSDEKFEIAAARAIDLMQSSLLEDGTWYEGENYHLFAHRGLWYIAGILDAIGYPLPDDVAERYRAGFGAVFRTALPDLTMMARRDSQYMVSLRQWRFAELCELGVSASADDAQRADLSSVLQTLYSADDGPAETGRRFSTAEVERNLPAAKLTRDDLGWKSLLFATPELPSAAETEPSWRRSVLLKEQGIAVLRRNNGQLLQALDYGHHGGGHGHPDRLNVHFSNGKARWLDDPGTGSYVARSLFWYRSGLAHNAPFTGWRTQSPGDGRLLAFRESDGASGAAAEFRDDGAGIVYRRSLVTLNDYSVDSVSWYAVEGKDVQLPLHLDPARCATNAKGQQGKLHDLLFEPAPLPPGAALDAGFEFVADVVCAGVTASPVLVSSESSSASLKTWLFSPAGSRLWKMTGPAPPGAPDANREFLVLHAGPSQGGNILIVHDWSSSILDASLAGGDQLVVRTRDGKTHTHHVRGPVWQVVSQDSKEPIFTMNIGADPLRTTLPASGLPVRSSGHTSDAVALLVPRVADLANTDARGLIVSLGEAHFRRSEVDWHGHREPRARITLAADDQYLLVAADVSTTPLNAAPLRDAPYLDNENPDVNSDGLQIHITIPADPSTRNAAAALLLVPESPGRTVRVSGGTRWLHALSESEWEATPNGWRISAKLRRDCLPDMGAAPFLIDVVVNLLAPGRERRSGQLVLSGGRGEWIYLMGDRQSPDKLLFARIDG